MQQNSHGRRHGKTFTQQLVQKIRITRHNHFRLRTPICIESIYQTIKTPQSEISALSNSISPSDGRNHRTSQPGNRSVPLDLLHLTPIGMAQRISHPRIHPQQLKTCRQTENPIRINVRRHNNRDSTLIWKHQIPNSGRQNENADQEPRRSLGSTWASLK